MKRILSLLVISLVSCTVLWASRAQSGVKRLTQPDGSVIEVLLHGDEHYNYYTTLDGKPLFRMADGRLELSTWEAVHAQAWSRSSAPRRVIDDYPSSSAKPAYFPHMGQPKVCIILMEFPDCPFTYTREAIDDWLNGDDEQFFSASASTGSVGRYFEYCSQGQFRPQFDVYGPYKTDSIAEWYGYKNGILASSARLMADALKAADPDVDFSQYDNYGDDGYIDLVYVIFSGEGANQSGNYDQPWSLSGTNSSLGTFDGRKACRFGISNEIIDGNGIPYQVGIGVFCHELSHTMGLPDLYNTSYSLDTWDNNGPEAWDLMDDGENVVNGMWPMPYTAWERDVFGWIELEELSEPADVTLYPLNDPQGRGKACKVVNPENPDEFYTLENIPDTEWYGWLGRYNVAGGMIVMHVNFDYSVFASNSVNNTANRPNLTIVPADGYLVSSASIGLESLIEGQLVQVDRAFYRSHLAGDPFPGAKEVTSLLAYRNYAGVEDMAKAFPITDIVKHDDGSVSFKFMGGVAAISEVSADAQPVRTYTLTGQPLPSHSARAGFVIVDGRVQLHH